MLAFQHTDYLIALAAIPLLLLLYFFVLNWKKKTIKKIGDANLVTEMIKNHSPQKFALKFVLILIAFAAGVFALANLRSPKGMEQVNRNGIDVMIALDVSKSMLAQDVKPNRLERAKQALGKLIDKLNNDRVGIVVFAGRAYLQMPLTGDHGAAKMYLGSASTEIVPTQGTVISDALKMCYASFNTKEKKYKAVILISDGEDHDEGALKIAQQMTEDGIVINTVGIGSPQGSTIIDELTNQEKKDVNGNTVITRLNEEELKLIAEKGNGSYQLFTNADELVTKLDAQLASMDQRTVTENSLVNYKYFFPYFLMLALFLMIAEFFISERKKISNLKMTVTSKTTFASFLFIASCLFPVGTKAQNDKALIKKGNEAYEKKEYDNAIKNYQQAAQKNPANSTAQYNLGNALYKNNKADEAVQAYDGALSNAASNADKAKAFYNKGVVLQNNKKLPECIEAYKNALKLTPQDEDARQNLQKALQQQKEQQKKEEKDKKEEKKPKDDKKQKEKDKPKDEEKQEQPKPQPSKLTKQDAEEKLKALLQQEKNLQDKLRKVNTATSAKPEKDW
ncbi:MAG: VWA domain-containing protein [Chitinophagaceae bacterium]|nr:VWA domain-containing protein [Chitinophagaceae bacterium]MBK8785885.1 VWA domain-containing protein [Chitinophagaceae bacterium]MBL0199769.1 VWA domain-containing protein [Chitinophagaceae bacterium]